jgi:hypothetical protein
MATTGRATIQIPILQITTITARPRDSQARAILLGQG